MRIIKLIKELERIKEKEGNIEVTTTGASMPEDGFDVFESTVETLMVQTEKKGNLGKRVRLIWQC